MTDEEIVVLLTMQFGAPNSLESERDYKFAAAEQYNAVTEFLCELLHAPINSMDVGMAGVVRLRRMYYAQRQINTGSPIDAPGRLGY